MQKDGQTSWEEEVYSVTEKGRIYVISKWEEKKKKKLEQQSEDFRKGFSVGFDF